MAEKLEIQIDTDRAQRSLEGLGKAADALVQQLATLGKSNGLDQLVTQLNNLKGTNLTATANGITQIANAVSSLPTGQLSSFAQQLNGLGAGAANNAANGLRQVAAAASTLGGSASGAQALAGAVQAAGQAAANAAINANALSSSVRQANGAMFGLSAATSSLIGFFAQTNASVAQMVGLFQQATGASAGMAAALVGIAAVGVFVEIAQAVGAMIKPILEATTQINSFRMALDATAGAGQGMKSLNELAGIANRTGGSMQVLANHFKQFKISADAAGVTSQQTVKIFEGFQTAFTVLGVSAQNSENAFRAISQMMSKGKVQAEELRGQLGEHLPNAVGIFARALGVSTAALDGMLQNGQVLAKDVLPKVAELLLKDYSPGLQEALRKLPAQLNIFNSSLFQLQAAFGNGNLLGSLQGFANGLNLINGAINNDGMRTFAAVLGDLVGVLTNVGSVLGGSFLAGFLAIPRAIGEAVNYGSQFLQWVNQTFIGLTGLTSVFTTIGGVINSVLAVFGSLAGVMASVVVASLALNGAVALGGAVMTAWGTATGVAAVAQRALAGAVGAAAAATGTQAAAATASTAATVALARASLTATAATGALANVLTLVTFGAGAAATAMRATGASMFSLTAISAGATAALTAVRNALFALAASNPLLLALTAAAVAGLAIWSAWPTIMAAVSSSMTQTQTAIKVLKDALEANENTAKNNAVALVQLGERHTSFEQQVARSKQKIEEFDQQLERNDHTLKQNELSMRASARLQQDFVSGLQQQQEALRMSAEKLQSQSAALREQANEYRHSSEGASAYGEQIRMGSQSMDGYQHRVRLINEEIKSLDHTIKASNQNMADARRRNDEFRDSLAAQKDKISTLKQEFERYGVLLNETTREYVKLFKETGAVDKAAGQYAVTLERLTLSQEKRNQLADEEIQRLEKQATAQLKVAEMLAKGVDARTKELQALGLSKDEIAKLNKEYSELTDAQKRGAQTTFEEIAAITTLKIARTEGISIVAAAKRATEELNEKHGTSVSTMDVLTQANKQLAKEVGTTSTEGKKAAETWGAINKAIDDGVKNTLEYVGNLAKSTAEFIKTGVAAAGAAVVWTGLSTVIAAVNLATSGLPDKMTQIATALETMKEPSSTVTTNLGAMATNLPAVQTAFANLVTVLPTTANEFARMGTAFQAIGPVLPTFASSFQSMVEPVSALSEPLKIVADNIVKLQPSMPPVAEAFERFQVATEKVAGPLESVTGSIAAIVATEGQLRSFATAAERAVDAFDKMREALTKAEPEVGKMATAANNVATGFEKAATNTNDFGTSLNNLIPRIEAVIEKMRVLKQAAEEALRAAQAASSASSSSSTESQSGRYGGLAGGLPETVSVSSGAFSSAPKLAKGVSNTNKLVSKAVGGRGIPSILHPNEAVVPLPHGRSIPVQFKGGDGSGGDAGGAAKGLARAMGQLGDAIAQQTPARDAGGQMGLSKGAPAGFDLSDAPNTSRGLFEPRTRNAGESSPGEVAAERIDMIAARSRRTGSVHNERDPTGPVNSDTPARSGNITINMTIQTPNADSFRRSQDQVQAETFAAMKRAFNRNT